MYISCKLAYSDARLQTQPESLQEPFNELAAIEKSCRQPCTSFDHANLLQTLMADLVITVLGVLGVSSKIKCSTGHVIDL